MICESVAVSGSIKPRAASRSNCRSILTDIAFVTAIVRYRLLPYANGHDEIIKPIVHIALLYSVPEHVSGLELLRPVMRFPVQITDEPSQAPH